MKSQGTKSTTNSNGPATGNSTPKGAVATQSKKTVVAVAAQAGPSVDDIRRRAYELYLHRQSTGTPGSADGDWKQAERELSKR